MSDFQVSPELLTIYLEDARSHLEALDHCLLELDFVEFRVVIAELAMVLAVAQAAGDFRSPDSRKFLHLLGKALVAFGSQKNDVTSTFAH